MTNYTHVLAEIEALRAQGETDILVTLSNRNCASGTYQAQWGEVGAITRAQAEEWGYEADDMMDADEFEAYTA